MESTGQKIGSAQSTGDADAVLDDAGDILAHVLHGAHVGLQGADSSVAGLDGIVNTLDVDLHVLLQLTHSVTGAGEGRDLGLQILILCLQVLQKSQLAFQP